MTTALEGGEWSAARPGRTLPPGKIRYPFCRRLGGPQGRSWRAENLVLTGIRSRTVQLIVSRYTDWATGPTHTHILEPRRLKQQTVPKQWCPFVSTRDIKSQKTIIRILCRFSKKEHSAVNIPVTSEGRQTDVFIHVLTFLLRVNKPYVTYN